MAIRFPPSDDPTQPPHPQGGWSGSLTEVTGAILAHEKKGYLVHPSGVFDGQGTYLHQGVHWRGRPLMTPPEFPVITRPLVGRWIWGGVLMEHFGHFIMESLGRLWPLAREQVDGIVFVAEEGYQPVGKELAGWQRLFLQLLQVDLPVHLLTGPTRVDRLLVPGQGFGIGPLIGGTQAFRDFVQSRFARDIAPEGGTKLYLSRSKLPAKLGGILREQQLERDLAGQGYEIFHPQDHSLQVQIARYKAATHVVGLDGSALHLFALVARPDQRVAVIKRRPGSAPDGIVDHLTGFAGQPPVVIDVLRRNWARSDRKGADNFSYGEVDFEALGKDLVSHGFLAPDASLRPLSDRRVLESVSRLDEQIKARGWRFIPLTPDGQLLAPNKWPKGWNPGF